MGKIDEIKAAVTTAGLVEQITGQPLKPPDGQGRMLGLCVFHDDHDPSMRVFFESGGYKCFSCGAKGGDVIDFWGAHTGVDQKAAIADLHSRYCNGHAVAPPVPVPVKSQPPAPKVADAPAAITIPEELIPEPGRSISINFPGKGIKRFKPSRVHVYRDEKGHAHHVILRMDGKRKLFIPARMALGCGWCGVAQDVPRKLYGLERLAGAKQILLVEGEKAADAAQEALPRSIAVLTWAGGAQAIDTADWGPLAGRSVVLWPDNDSPGIEAMQSIGEILLPKADSLKVLDPRSLNEKGDAADFPPGSDMLAWIKDHISPFQAREIEQEPPIETPPYPDPDPGDDGGETFSPEAVKRRRSAEFPFHILGQHDGEAFFLKRLDGRVRRGQLSQLGRSEFLSTLARRDTWRKAFGGLADDGQPIGWPTIFGAVQDHLMDELERLPEYDPDRTRGRGCWPHHGRVAFNRGDQVEIESRIEVENYVDGIVYERGSALPIADEALSNEDGARLIGILDQCSWQLGHAPIALAGWIALGPITGAIPWRPHIWLTGPSGCGKSTILNEIIYPAIGRESCLELAGNTTEAGLRQTIKRDAIPILLDEIESGSKSVSAIMDLARSASMGDTVVRGTPGGGALFYHVRSSFCFSSINTSISKSADESRITRLSLNRSQGPAADAQYTSMMDDVSNILTPDFGARLAKRMIDLAPIVLASIARVEDAVTRRFGSRRLAQQWGAMLAGAHMLTSEKEITDDEADAMARYVPDDSARVQIEEDDSYSMITHLTAYQIDTPTRSGRARVSVIELIDRLVEILGRDDAEEINRADSEDVLARIGIKVVSRAHATGTERVVAIACKHPYLIDKVFAGTAWQHSYTERLRDMPRTEPGSQMRFAGRRYSTTLVPVNQFTGEEEPS